MKIKSGHYYRTSDGRKVGPMTGEEYLEGGLCEKLGDERMWRYDGTHKNEPEMSSADDLIAEWTDEPTTPDLAALAAQHRIKITERVGELSVEYDGRM